MKTNILFPVLILLLSSACVETQYVEIEGPAPIVEGKVSITFDARYGDANFELNKPFPYKLNNEAGEFDLEYEFTRLRYWVSNVSFIDVSGEEHLVPNSYYLIEENNAIPVQDGSFNKVYPANKREKVDIENIPAGDYKAIKFHIGVEPKYNDNLTMTVGELNALNGMAADNWMWFTSYIFTSVSGKMTWLKDDPESKNFYWETGSNDFYGDKVFDFAEPITINSTTSSEVIINLDVKRVVDFELPWVNNVIGATRPALMEELTNNYVNSFVLKSATSTSGN